MRINPQRAISLCKKYGVSYADFCAIFISTVICVSFDIVVNRRAYGHCIRNIARSKKIVVKPNCRIGFFLSSCQKRIINIFITGLKIIAPFIETKRESFR